MKSMSGSEDLVGRCICRLDQETVKLNPSTVVRVTQPISEVIFDQEAKCAVCRDAVAADQIQPTYNLPPLDYEERATNSHFKKKKHGDNQNS